MSESLSPPAPTTIKEWVRQATAALTLADIHSARLDSIILLEDLLNKERSWILAHEDYMLSTSQLEPLAHSIKRRAGHVPLAYIRGFIEFYGRRFTVTPDVLIPRPETEDMIDMLKEVAELLPARNRHMLIDIGTGSGCIGITALLERSDLEVWLTDASEAALTVAQRNLDSLTKELVGRSMHAVHYCHGDLLLASGVPGSASMITANLPYVAEGFEISLDAHAEPKLALFAEDEGYELIERLLPQAAEVLLPKGYLLLESDPWQQERIIKSAADTGFNLVRQRRFHLALQRR